jgi:hypothetical protein
MRLTTGTIIATTFAGQVAGMTYLLLLKRW